MLFDGWQSIGRIVILAIGTYVLIVAALRVAGAQALAKMSAYDLVITIAMGSIVATVPLSAGVTLADGAAVVATYLVLQGALRKTLKQWDGARAVAKNPAQLVLWEGTLLRDRMREVNVTEDEVRAAVRKQGFGVLEDVQAVVLESDGNWSVIGRSNTRELSALADVEHPD